MSKKVSISVVTVGMNHLNLLKGFLYSIYVKCPPIVDFELIYVDNCSKDGSTDFIKKNYNQVIIIENKSIKGFSANNNIGVENSKGKYILILNPDIVVTPGAIDALYEYMRENEQIGIAVPKLLNIDLSLQFSVRKFINVRILFHRILYGGKDNLKSKAIKQYLLHDFDSDKIQPIDWALGAAMFLTRKTYEKINGFDEGYFLYVEDVDICMKSWKNGMPVMYIPNSVFIHAHQKASQNGWNKQKFMHLRSMFRFFIKHNILFKTYRFT